MIDIVKMGNALRHTSTTGMNERSSRSHTILTLQVVLSCHNSKNSSFKSVRSSKLCLVDLAGSERARKTGNTGTQLKESAHINTGLFALGNVIRALSDRRQNRHSNNSGSAHVPYRNAKITRLLRDSLGGSAHMLMVACVSPSHHFVAETLGVLKFASTARYVQNRPSPSFRQRLQERLRAVSHSPPTRMECSKEKLLQERKTHLMLLEEEKQRLRIQVRRRTVQ
uniref:Kinesin motor domain-containing protein n=1 Tax=Neolamprologus brichardi TaxID=32507 RepID=A0A3Q4GDI0_NEOBR